MLIDTHCHLDMLDYNKLHQSYQDVITKACNNGVEHLIHISCYPQSFSKYFPVLSKFKQISFTIGIHPLYVADHLSELKQIDILLEQYRESIVALGEMGLDKHYDHNIEQQLIAFEYQMQLAQDTGLPVVIHTREAKQQTLEVLQKFSGVTGVIHCYTQDMEFVEIALDLGYYIGVGGVMTFKNSTELRQVLKVVPMNRILLETDAPYMTPVPYRGKENQPAYIKDIAHFVASEKGISFNEVSLQTTENAKKLFGLTI